jgi:dihydrofolate reductase
MKEEPGQDLALIGSSVLDSTLATHGLIDEFRFFVVPVLLGQGKRVLDGLPARIPLTLQQTRVMPSGVVAQYYTPTGLPPTGAPPTGAPPTGAP